MIAGGDFRKEGTVIEMGRVLLLFRNPVRGYRADINEAGETDEVFGLVEGGLRALQGARQQDVGEGGAYTQSRIQ
ncbi:acetolactate synthase, partial [Klebsiella pneumoniae]|nr:acetolactate synthase [Klebsiella pneumoniae]